MLLEHDLLKRIGKVQTLWRPDGWFVADFTLDPELTAELHEGQPVSVGLSLFKSGSRFLSEVSVVRRGAVEGEEITSRVALKPPEPTPARPAAAQPPVAAAAPPVVYRTPPSARAAAEDAELRRRLDWLEQHTGRYDIEAVVLGMQRELNGPTLDEVYAAHRTQRAAA